MIKFEQIYDLDSLNYILILIFADELFEKSYFKTRTVVILATSILVGVNKCAIVI